MYITGINFSADWTSTPEFALGTMGMTIDAQAVRRYQVPVDIRVAGRTLYTTPDFGA